MTLIASQSQPSISVRRSQRPFSGGSRRPSLLAPTILPTGPAQPQIRIAPIAVSDAAEPSSATLPDAEPREQQSNSAARAQRWAPTLVSRRRMLVNAGMLAMTPGLCACCPGVAHAGAWTYGDVEQPRGWPLLCATGIRQSPIDIPLKQAGAAIASQARALGPIQVRGYGSVEGRVVNTGHGLQVNVDPGAGVTINGTRLDLVQFHWHRSSEHTFDGRHHAMEVHLVHKNADTGGLGVLGILLQSQSRGTGSSQPLATALDCAPKTSKDPAIPALFDLTALLPPPRSGPNGSTRPYVYYDGSLTTPPCGEPVQWFVLADTMPVDPYEVLAFESMLESTGVPLGRNSRPVQQLGARMLQWYGFPAGAAAPARQRPVSDEVDQAEEEPVQQRQVSEEVAPPPLELSAQRKQDLLEAARRRANVQQREVTDERLQAEERVQRKLAAMRAARAEASASQRQFVNEAAFTAGSVQQRLVTDGPPRLR